MPTWRVWLIRVLRVVVAWLEGPLPTPPEPAPDPVRELVRDLIALAETAFAPGTTGEYKRHHVLAKLQKAFPDKRTRDLAFLIESVLQETT